MLPQLLSCLSPNVDILVDFSHVGGLLHNFNQRRYFSWLRCAHLLSQQFMAPASSVFISNRQVMYWRLHLYIIQFSIFMDVKYKRMATLTAIGSLCLRAGPSRKSLMKILATVLHAVPVRHPPSSVERQNKRLLLKTLRKTNNPQNKLT